MKRAYDTGLIKKSESSIRDVPIPPFLLNILDKAMKNVGLEDYVLTGNSKFIEPRNFEYHLTAVLKECEIKHYSVIMTAY